MYKECILRNKKQWVQSLLNYVMLDVQNTVIQASAN
jgi:hypothetical protein